MSDLPISFAHDGKIYNGSFSRAFSSGEQSWHLFVVGHYWGSLKMQHEQWVFEPATRYQWLKDFAEIFKKLLERSQIRDLPKVDIHNQFRRHLLRKLKSDLKNGS